MPIYEYKCGKCGVVEVMQRITEPALKKCPNCKRKVERLVSRSSFVLKGTGWYASDYGKKTPEPAAPSESSNGSSESAANGAASASTVKPEAKTESKPKAESKPASAKAATAKSAD
ncbi:MAG TPA: zinc ribbon domain-containing protein [Candidatus Binataceae bacterium]|nr:zinc ribbon domain-containing protein [Candidatus Binataceae bacterium]